MLVRYADDVVLEFERKRNAERFLHALGERLGQFDLACIRTRPGSSSSAGSRKWTAGHEGWAARRRSTSWASRTTARRPGAGGSGSDASPRCKADEPHSEAHRRGSAAAQAPRPSRGRPVAGAGRQRVAELLRRPDEFPLPAKLHLHPETDMAEGSAPTVATRPLQLATAASPRGTDTGPSRGSDTRGGNSGSTSNTRGRSRMV